MQPRPLSDRIAGIDDAYLALVSGCAVSEADGVTVRFALADMVRRHGELLDRLYDGAEGWELVGEGLVLSWPDDAEVLDGLPRGGFELLYVARAVLEAAGAGRGAVVHSAGTLLNAAAAHLDAEDLAMLVAVEFLEALVFASLDD